MRKTTCLILILFSFGILEMGAQENEAADEVLFKILKAGVALRKDKQLNQADLTEIVCLTNIGTKKGAGNYMGISLFPSESEIQLWAEWLEKNKSRITYSTSSDLYNKEIYNNKRKVIQVEYESGKYRNSVCGEDQNFKEMWESRKVKN